MWSQINDFGDPPTRYNYRAHAIDGLFDILEKNDLNKS